MRAKQDQWIKEMNKTLTNTFGVPTTITQYPEIDWVTLRATLQTPEQVMKYLRTRSW